MRESSPLLGRRGLLTAAALLPLALMVGTGILSHTASAHLDRERESLHRLADLKWQTASLLTAMVDEETGQRGYILSQNPVFLEPRDRALHALPAQRRHLASSFTDPASRPLLAALGKSMDARLAFAAETVDLQQRGDHRGSVALVSTGEGKVLMDRVRADAAALEQQLDQWTHASETRTAAVARSSERISWGMVAVDGLFVALLIVLLLRLRRTEQFLHICAWSRTIEYQGEWLSIETYLSRKFGFSISHGISPLEATKMRDALARELPAAPPAPRQE